MLGFFTGDPATATAAVQSGDLQRSRDAGPNAGDGGTRLTAASCENGAAACGVDVKLESVGADSKGNQQTKKLAHVSYPPDALPHLRAVFQSAPVVPPAAAAPPSAPPPAAPA